MIQGPFAGVQPYIAVEGVKGAGKSSAIAIVRASLQRLGIRVAALDPTAPGLVMHPLELLYRGGVHRLDGLTERVHAYRSNRQARLLQRRQMGAEVLLGDRSFVTTLATRWHRTRSVGERAHYDRCRALEWAIPIPHHVIYLDVPLNELRRRLQLRRRRDGVQDEDLNRLVEVQEAYTAIRRSSLAELRGIQWHMISADAPVESVAARLLSTVLGIVADKKPRNESADMR